MRLTISIPGHESEKNQGPNHFQRHYFRLLVRLSLSLTSLSIVRLPTALGPIVIEWSKLHPSFIHPLFKAFSKCTPRFLPQRIADSGHENDVKVPEIPSFQPLVFKIGSIE